MAVTPPRDAVPTLGCGGAFGVRFVSATLCASHADESQIPRALRGGYATTPHNECDNVLAPW
jgi:hypothetical protein